MQADLIRGVAAGEQLAQVLLALEELIALLVDVELSQSQVGDLFVQVQGDLGIRQHLALLIEDAREQQAAAEHADLLVEIALGLGDAIQPALDLDVFLAQVVNFLRGFNQLLTELLIDLALFFQEGISLGASLLTGDVGHRLIGAIEPLGVDLVLDQLNTVLQLLQLDAGQILALERQILQVGVVVEILLLLLQLQAEQLQLGGQ